MCLAIPGKILNISKKDGVCAGRVEVGGIVNQVCLDFVPEAEVGDYVVAGEVEGAVGVALERWLIPCGEHRLQAPQEGGAARIGAPCRQQRCDRCGDGVG